MAFALTYFAEHYVFDIVVGYVYAVAAVWIVGRILDRRSTTHTDVANAEVPHG